MRALVTGGAGFIGSHVADSLLARGDEVTILDDLSDGRRENVPAGARLVEGDIRDPAAVFAEAKPELCFHLAAQKDVRVSVVRPDHDADINILGTVRVLEAARELGAQVVFSSTGGAIYGECQEPAREDKEREPLAPYGTSKLAGEAYLGTWNALHGTRHVVLRFGNVYGPRQLAKLEGGVVAIFMDRLRAGENVRIFGNGEQERDFVYVGDVVDAILASIGRDGGVYNVGTGEATSVNTLFDGIRRAGGVDAEAEYADARPGDLLRSVLDVSRAERELGWRPGTPLEEGLRLTWG